MLSQEGSSSGKIRDVFLVSVGACRRLWRLVRSRRRITAEDFSAEVACVGAMESFDRSANSRPAGAEDAPRAGTLGLASFCHRS